MAEGERVINGKVLRKNAAGEWEIVGNASPPPVEESTKPITKPEISAWTRAQRAIRDFSVPVDIGAAIFPPMGVANAVRGITSGDPMAGKTDIPLGTGQLRNVLTALGGSAGATVAGGLTAPTGPGAVAGAAAGYGAGATIGSGVGQSLERLAPNLLQTGYAPETNGAEPTDPSIAQAVGDAAESAVLDLATAGVGKGAKFAVKALNTRKAAGGPGMRGAMAEWLLTRKYNPDKKGALPSPVDPDFVEAVNANPNVPITVRDVMPATSKSVLAQESFQPDKTTQLAKERVQRIFENVDKLRDDVGKNVGSDKSMEALGRRGLKAVDDFKKAADAEISDAYRSVERAGGVYTPPASSAPPKTRTPMEIALDLPAQAGEAPGPVLGPVKLANYHAKYQTRVPELDKLIAEINDPALAAELRIEKKRLGLGEDATPKSWQAVHEAEIRLGELANKRSLPKSLRRVFSELDQTLQRDIEHNLGGKVAETAPYWQKGADVNYKKAKQLVVAKNDAFPKEIEQRIAAASGDVLARPGERGGDFAALYRDVLKSPQHAERIAKVAGKENTAVAFFNQFLKPFTDGNTKQINGAAALKKLNEEGTQKIAKTLLNRDQYANLKQLLTLSERTPAVSKFAPFMVDRMEAGTAMHGTGAAFNAVTGGSHAGVISSAAKITALMSTDAFAGKFLTDPAFARRLVNSLGKSTKRPGADQEFAQLLKLAKGVRLLIQTGGKDYLFDSNTNELTPVPTQK